MNTEQLEKSDIILVCGLPASGKSHFARKYFSGRGRKKVSRKEMRQQLYQMLTFGDKWSEGKFDLVDENLVKHIERKCIEHLLQMGEKLVIDNLSISSMSREAYVQLAKRMKKTISAVFINTGIATCLRNNRTRPAEEIVPEKIISNLAADIELPERREGFTDILVISNYEEK